MTNFTCLAVEPRTGGKNKVLSVNSGLIAAQARDNKVQCYSGCDEEGPRMGRPGTKKQRLNNHATETRMAGLLDSLTEFEKFKEQLLPALRKELLAGASSEELRARYQSMLTARQLQIALTEPDAAKALSAIKDLQDRTEGKAVERSEQTHRLENLSDNQFDSLLLTELKGLKRKQTRPN